MDSTEKNAKIILKELIKSDLDSFTGNKIEKLTRLSPSELNDAINYLEDIDALNVLKYLGTSPYNFGYVSVTSKGQEIYQKNIPGNVAMEKNIPEESDRVLSPSNEYLEWEKSIHLTAFEYLKYKDRHKIIDILEESSLNLLESSDTWLDGDRTLTGWHLYIKVPMDLKEHFNENIEKEISEVYEEALGADHYLRDIHVEIKKIKDSKAHSLYSVGEYMEIGPKYDYDVVLSFAGENRDYVEKVANQLLYKGIKVFYDKFETETIDNWGKNLYTHFDEIYRKKARYCIIFISKHYANKVWTNHERQSAQARAFEEREEYVLPVRFDETPIPGIIPTVGYINGNKVSPEELAEMIVKKVGSYKNNQDKRKVEVDLWIDNEKKPLVTICAYNPGYHSVSLIKFKYMVNDMPIDIIGGIHESDRSKYDGASVYYVSFDKMINFPYVLKEGEAVFITQNERNLATTLYYKDFSGKVKLSAFFETAQKKIYKSKSTICLDIEKCRNIDESKALKLK